MVSDSGYTIIDGSYPTICTSSGGMVGDDVDGFNVGNDTVGSLEGPIDGNEYEGLDDGPFVGTEDDGCQDGDAVGVCVGL